MSLFYFILFFIIFLKIVEFTFRHGWGSDSSFSRKEIFLTGFLFFFQAGDDDGYTKRVESGECSEDVSRRARRGRVTSCRARVTRGAPDASHGEGEVAAG